MKPKKHWAAPQCIAYAYICICNYIFLHACSHYTLWSRGSSRIILYLEVPIRETNVQSLLLAHNTDVHKAAASNNTIQNVQTPWSAGSKNPRLAYTRRAQSTERFANIHAFGNQNIVYLALVMRRTLCLFCLVVYDIAFASNLSKAYSRYTKMSLCPPHTFHLVYPAFCLHEALYFLTVWLARLLATMYKHTIYIAVSLLV